MIHEMLLFTAYLAVCILVTAAAFYVGKLIGRKIKDFLDRRRRL